MAGAEPGAARCEHCREPVAEGARKCPHCLAWQSRWLPDPQSPRGVVAILLAVVVPIFALIVFGPARAVFRSPPSPAALSVVESTHHASGVGAGAQLSVVGLLRNADPDAVGGVHLEVRFFDAEGRLVDSLAASDRALVVPGRGEASFRALGPAAREPGAYARHEVRVTRVAWAAAF